MLPRDRLTVEMKVGLLLLLTLLVSAAGAAAADNTTCDNTTCTLGWKYKRWSDVRSDLEELWQRRRAGAFIPICVPLDFILPFSEDSWTVPFALAIPSCQPAPCDGGEPSSSFCGSDDTPVGLYGYEMCVHDNDGRMYELEILYMSDLSDDSCTCTLRRTRHEQQQHRQQQRQRPYPHYALITPARDGGICRDL